MDIPVTVHVSNEEPSNDERKQPQRAPSSNRVQMTIVVLVVIAAGIWLTARNQNLQLQFGKKSNAEPQITKLAMQMGRATPNTDDRAVAVQQSWIANFADIEFANAGDLVDVSGGSASGTVGTDMITGVYHLYATFANLPEPRAGFSYSGWVVRAEPLSIIRTGALTASNGQYVNAYLSRTDLRDHDAYVLTLAPNDSDGASAEHVLEGTITPRQ